MRTCVLLRARGPGSWAQHGSTYGGGKTRRLTFGSGGGAGNSYSPTDREDNRGGYAKCVPRYSLLHSHISFCMR